MRRGSQFVAMARKLKTYQTWSGFFDLAVAAPSVKAAGEAWGSRTQQSPKKNCPLRDVDSKAARAASIAFEREQKRREMERRKQEATRENERKRREQAIATAERALQEAKREHETKIKKIEKDRAALDRRSQAENARWEKQKEKLEAALRRAND